MALPLVTCKRERRRLGGALAVLCLLLAAMPASSAAATFRYAAPAPGASGTACTKAVPCDIVTAVSGAPSGADIFVYGNRGDYNLSSGIVTTQGTSLHLHGYKGRPRLIFADGGFRLATGTAEKLYVEGNSSSTTFALDTSAASANRVVAQNKGDGHACYMDGATLKNSVCWQSNTASGDLAVETDGTDILRNVTAWAPGPGGVAILAYGRGSVPGVVRITNVIARGGPGGASLQPDADDDTADATIIARHSNFGAINLAGANLSRAHVDSNGTNQSGAPKLVDASNGNFHQKAGSRTIDAGINKSANGTQDIDGDPRKENGQTDIGADEFVPRLQTTITRGPSGNTTDRTPTFKFTATQADATFKCSLDGAPFHHCSSPKTYVPLSFGPHTFSVRAISASGHADPTPAKRNFNVIH